MARINSKKKGNKFELDVCKSLQKIFEEHTTEKFMRVPNSGAIMGGGNAILNQNASNSAKRSLTADIITPDSFRFFIEAKAYKEIDIYNLLTKKSVAHNVYKWIEECLVANQSGYDGWFIVAKGNRKDWLIIAPYQFFNELLVIDIDEVFYLNFFYKKKRYGVMSYNNFFELCCKEMFFKNK